MHIDHYLSISKSALFQGQKLFPPLSENWFSDDDMRWSITFRTPMSNSHTLISYRISLFDNTDTFSLILENIHVKNPVFDKC